jgi:pentatricopeptide repeat protein
MQDRGILPDVVAYTTVLHVCSKSRQWPMVLGLVREMRTKGFAMSRTTANTVIHDMQVRLLLCVNTITHIHSAAISRACCSNVACFCE